MYTYSCGNCGEILPGPDIGRCPYCGVLLRGTQEGAEEERLRRQRNYRRNRPEAVARRQKIRSAFEDAGTYLIAIIGGLLTLTVFVGGGAALGWFVLPLLFGRETAISLTVAGAILGGLLLYLVAWRFSDPTLPDCLTGKPDWLDAIDREAKGRKRAHQGYFRLLIVLAYLLSAFLLGSIGWYLGKNNIGSIPLISLLLGLAAAYLARRFLGSALEFGTLLVIFVMIAYGVDQGLTRLFDTLGWNAQISNPTVSALVGILAALPLAYFLAKRIAGPPPDTWAMRKEAILAAIVQNPSRISDLDSYDRDDVLSKLKELAVSAPEAWKLFSPELQMLVPPQVIRGGDTGKGKKTK